MTQAAPQSLDEILSHCIHCGMCLPVCPTYALTSQEKSSPRGRIRLMRSVQDGTLYLSDEFVDEMYFCLDCQACQTACPAGVQYGALVENARELIAEERREPFRLSVLKQILLKGILASKSRTKLSANVLRLYRQSGLWEAVEGSNILNLFSERLQMKHAILPVVARTFFDDSMPEVVSPKGNPRGRVAFLTGCIMNVSFPEVHRDALEVLVRNGFEVVLPKHQVCCGSLHGHNGDNQTAKTLARQNVDVFEWFEFDALIVDSAGCSAFLKEYGAVLSDDEGYRPRAEALARKTRDITEFLVEVGFKVPEPCEEIGRAHV